MKNPRPIDEFHHYLYRILSELMEKCRLKGANVLHNGWNFPFNQRLSIGKRPTPRQTAVTTEMELQENYGPWADENLQSVKSNNIQTSRNLTVPDIGRKYYGDTTGRKLRWKYLLISVFQTVSDLKLVFND